MFYNIFISQAERKSGKFGRERKQPMKSMGQQEKRGSIMNVEGLDIIRQMSCTLLDFEVS